MFKFEAPIEDEDPAVGEVEPAEAVSSQPDSELDMFTSTVLAMAEAEEAKRAADFTQSEWPILAQPTPPSTRRRRRALGRNPLSALGPPPWHDK